MVGKTNTGSKIGRARHDVLDGIAMLGVLDIITPPKGLAQMNIEPEFKTPKTFKFLGKELEFGYYQSTVNESEFSSYL